MRKIFFKDAMELDFLAIVGFKTSVLLISAPVVVSNVFLLKNKSSLKLTVTSPLVTSRPLIPMPISLKKQMHTNEY